MERWKVLQDTQTKIFEIQQDVTVNKARTADKAFQKWDDYIRGGGTTAADSSALKAADAALGGEFPTKSRATQSARAVRISLPDPSKVMRSLYEVTGSRARHRERPERRPDPR
jgi:hypothetical protein